MTRTAHLDESVLEHFSCLPQPIELKSKSYVFNKHVRPEKVLADHHVRHRDTISLAGWPHPCLVQYLQCLYELNLRIKETYNCMPEYMSPKDVFLKAIAELIAHVHSAGVRNQGHDPTAFSEKLCQVILEVFGVMLVLLLGVFFFLGAVMEERQLTLPQALTLFWCLV